MYECALPQPRERRICTNAGFPSHGNYANVRMGASPASGTAQMYECGLPQPRELRKCTNGAFPSLGNCAYVRVRASRGSGTAPMYECGPPQPRELRICTKAGFPSLGNYANVRMRASHGDSQGITGSCDPSTGRRGAVGPDRSRGAPRRRGIRPASAPLARSAGRCLRFHAPVDAVRHSQSDPRAPR